MCTVRCRGTLLSICKDTLSFCHTLETSTIRCDRFRYTLDQFTFQFADLADPQARFQNASASDSGDDTDDEIKWIQLTNSNRSLVKKEPTTTMMIMVDPLMWTAKWKGPTPDWHLHHSLGWNQAQIYWISLPSSQNHFLFYGEFDAAERKQLTCYITAFDG